MDSRISQGNGLENHSDVSQHLLSHGEPEVQGPLVHDLVTFDSDSKVVSGGQPLTPSVERASDLRRSCMLPQELAPTNLNTCSG